MALRLTVIVPTKNRCPSLQKLLESIKRLQGLARIQPQIIIGDNHSGDETWSLLQQTAAGSYPAPFHPLRVSRPGKSAVLNDAIRLATGDVLAFLDYDVLPHPGWLEAMETFFLDAAIRPDRERSAFHSRSRKIPTS